MNRRGAMASAMQIMAMLEGEALFGVYHDFQRKHTKDGSGLTIEEFVGSCLRHIPHVRRFLPSGKCNSVKNPIEQSISRRDWTRASSNKVPNRAAQRMWSYKKFRLTGLPWV